MQRPETLQKTKATSQMLQATVSMLHLKVHESKIRNTNENL